MDYKQLIHDSVIATLAACGMNNKPTDYFRATEARLYAYPTLVSNISQYKLDIRDLKTEKVTEKSKDITCWGGSSGLRLTPEEKQEARILSVELKLRRDWTEVAAIDQALDRLANRYGSAAEDFIRQIYFNECDLQVLADKQGVSLSSIQRKRSNFVRKIALVLYGAEALQ